ncbi:MAG: hypothetical protein A4S09_03745 [Proteobacteria bacterium SG_bin7]|nr:MAG: hypothetical protein A4S09_03745 [Proteobacteria bacterium SG_bin7]
MILLFVAIFTLLQSLAFSDILPHDDRDFKCIEKSEAQRMVQDFNIDVKSFGGAELCDASIDFKKLANDLILLKEGRFTDSGENIFIRNFIDSKEYYSWLLSMTRGIDRRNDVTTATAYNSGGYFTMQNGWAKLPTLARVGILIHEARHTNFYSHIQCNQGPYMNSAAAACDWDYNSGGAHAVEMEYYARVSVLGENFHPVYKSMARLMAMARSNFVFNNSPIKRREALFAILKNGQGALYEIEKPLRREIPSVDGTLKRTSFGAAIFTNDKAYPIEMYGSTDALPGITDIFSYYKLILNTRLKLLDYEEFDTNQRRYVVAITEGNSSTSYNFLESQWSKEKLLTFQPAKSATTLETGEQGYFLIDQNHDIYSFNVNRNSFEKSFSFKWNPEFKNIAKVESHLLILKNDSKIYERTGNGDIIASPVYKGNYKDMVAIPLYDGFAVEP